LRFLRSICTSGLCWLLLTACADTAIDGSETYEVRSQDTLYSIAWRHDVDFRDLARWNNLGADLRISVGQVLLLGPGGAPPPQSRGSSAASAPAPRPAMLAPRPAVPAPSTVGSRAQVIAGANNSALTWVWPTDRIATPKPVPGGGILLAGRSGQDVRAAGAGRVVYTGTGMRGYGNLIIIKHADSLLTAYAHNRDMLVHEGQEVVAGQVIAHMGEGAQQAPNLYFEMRQNGRPVDPMPYLLK
jgi:lipoprotein NlpD